MRKTSPVILLMILVFRSLVAATDEVGYPPGTLTPLVDLDLRRVEVAVPEQYRDDLPEGLSLNLPPGFSVGVFAAQLRSPRFMAFDDKNVLHVANMGADQILALPDGDGDGHADRYIVAARGFRTVHNLAFYKGDLYVGDTHQIVRCRDGDGDLVYEERQVIVDDIPSKAWHTTRTLVIDAENEKMYLSVGSPCDLCRPQSPVAGGSSDALPANAEWGTILEFNIDGSGRRIFASGVRNVVGMTLHPVTNEIWGNNNGHDLEGRTRPPEWIDIIREGDFLGHPFVHSHQVWNDFSIERYQRMLPITAADSALAVTQKRPVALVPAHYAPMGIEFYSGDQFPAEYHNTAFVAFRAGKAKLSSHPGYQVMALFSEPDGANARMGSFITGFQTGTTQQSVWGFPVGLAIDAEGSLYVGSDHRNHLILKVTHSPVSGSWRHNLPDALTQGSILAVDATVFVERRDPAGGPLRVIADLSSFGGPFSLPLERLEDDQFRLQTQLDVSALPNGVYLLRVTLEQEIAGRRRAFDLVKSISLLPPDLPILDDALAAGWRMSGGGGARVGGFGAQEPVFNGIGAAAVMVEPVNFFTPWVVEMQPPQPIAHFGFAGLRFAFHPGDLQLPTVPILNVFIDDLPVDLVRRPATYQIDLELRQWQVVEIPFTAFSVTNKYGDGLRDWIEEVPSIRFEGNLNGTFYLDDVRLVTNIPAVAPQSPFTAVVEDNRTDLPLKLDLRQNYPNPFNHSTVLCYTLTLSSMVELVVYNTSGQEVAGLVYGLRQPGTHTLRWDGRDNADEELATGLYLCRLRIGQRTLTRKLLLMR